MYTTNFGTAACWADDYKNKLNTGTGHYIDLPFSLDGTSTNGFVPASFDIVQAINLAITTLQSSSVVAAPAAHGEPGQTLAARMPACHRRKPQALLTTDNCSKLMGFSELRVSDVNGRA
jgi:hypothetical protein